MVQIRFLTFIGACWLFVNVVACNNSSKHSFCESIAPQQMFISLDSTIYIKVDQQQYEHRKISSWYNENFLYYIGLDQYTNCLEIYDIKSRKFLNRLCLPDNGKYESFRISDFIFHNPDSIFLFSENHHNFYLINIDNQVVNSYNLNGGKIEEWYAQKKTAGIEFIVSRPFYDSQNKLLYLPSTPYTLMGDSRFYNHPNMITYNLVEKQAKSIGGFYPSDYVDEAVSPTKQHFWFQKVRTFSNDSIMVSYHGSSRVVIGSFIESKNFAEFCRGVNYEVDNKGFNVFSDDKLAIRNYLIESSFYPNMFYLDSSRKYVCTVKHKQPLKNAEGKVNQPNDAKVGILVYNESLELEANYILDDSSYGYYFILPCRDGLLFIKDKKSIDEENIITFGFLGI